MLSNEEIEQHLMGIDKIDHVKVDGDGYHYHVTIVTDHFLGMSKVARQQWVYKQLNEYITTGKLHAIQMKTWTKEEWEQAHG